MELLHRTHNLRIAPRKIRLVADKLRHLPAEQGIDVLRLMPQKGAYLLQKSLQSAIQTAKDKGFDEKTLKVQRIWCDEGPKMKRMIGHSRGRMSRIMKHHSHVSLVLSGEAKQSATKKAAVKTDNQESN